MQKVDTKYITYYISKNVVKMVVKPEEINAIYAAQGLDYPYGYIHDQTVTLKREMVHWDECQWESCGPIERYDGYVWVMYDDSTFWDDELDDGEGNWRRILNRDGSLPSYYDSKAFSQTLDYALSFIFNE